MEAAKKPQYPYVRKAGAMRSTSRKCQALLKGGVVLLFVFTVIGPATALDWKRQGRHWGDTPEVMLSVDTTSLDFGRVAVGDFQDLALTINNESDIEIMVSIVRCAPPFFIDFDEHPFILHHGVWGQLHVYAFDAGASKTFTVRFSPTSSGDFYGDILIRSGGGGIKVNLRGEAYHSLRRRH